MSDNNNTSSGVGFFSLLGLLGLLFITLKLLGVVNWSWLWVLAPIWIPIAIVIFILFIVFVVAIIKSI